MAGYCAHSFIAPMELHHNVYKTRYAAIVAFRNAVEYRRDEIVAAYATYLELGTLPTLDLYPACDMCDRSACFHDYPMVRYTVGPRGGIVRECI